MKSRTPTPTAAASCGRSSDARAAPLPHELPFAARSPFDRSLRAPARAVLRLLDALAIERATLVGHDTGGGVALILAVEHPDRVARLVLVNAVAYDTCPVADMLAL